MGISREFIEKVKDSTDLLALAGEYTEMSPAGTGIWRGKCPHPLHQDSTPSFTVYRKGGEWSWCCYGCHYGSKDSGTGNYGSDAIAFIQWVNNGNKSWRDSVNLLAERVGLEVEKDDMEGIYQSLAIKAGAYHGNLFPFVKEYLYLRGLDDADIEKWKIGFGTFEEYGGGDKSVGRIVFPLFDRAGRVLGSSRRIMPNETADVSKYWNSPNSRHFSKRKFLYGINRVDPSFGEIRITEGVFDVILADKYGAGNVVAPLGTSFTDDHADIVKAMGKLPCICMDGDMAGQKAARRIAAMLSKKEIYPKVLVLPDGMDMADLANDLKDGLEDYIRRKSLPYWQFILQDRANEFEARLNEMRQQALPDIMEALRGIKSDNENIMLKSYVKERFGVLL